MLLKVACVLSLFPAQQDPAAEPSAARAAGESEGANTPNRLILRAARRLPSSTLGLIVIPSVRENRMALAQTGLGRLRDHLTWPPQAPAAAVAVTAIAQAAGVEPERIWDAMLGNACCALLSGENNEPEFLMTLEIGDLAEKLARLHESVPSRLAAQALGLRAEAFEDRAVWTCSSSTEEQQELAVAFVGGHVLASNSRTRLVSTLQQWQKGDFTAQQSLAEIEEFQAFLRQQPTSPGPIVASGFVHTTALRELFKTGLPGVDPAELDRIQTVLTALGLDQLGGAGLTITAHGPDLIEDWYAGVPMPRGGLLGAVFGGTNSLGKDLALLIPDRCQGYTFGSLDITGVWRGITSAMHTASPDAGAQFQAALRMLRTRTGLDFDADVLAHVGNRVAMMSWGRVDSSGDSSDFALLIELNDPSAIEKTIDRLVQRSRLPLRRRTLYGRKAYQFITPNGRADRIPGLATTENWLVLASDERPLAEVLEQLRKPRQNIAALQHFAKLPANSIWTSRSEIRDLIGRMIVAAQRADETHGSGSRRGEILERMLGDATGPLRFRMTTDRNGVATRFASPYGNGITVAVVITIMTSAFPEWGESILGESSNSRGDALAAWSSYLQFLAKQQVEFRTQKILDRDRDESGEFGSFGQLIASGSLRAEALGERQGDDTWIRDGYRFQVLLPEGTDSREEQFAIVAWPDSSRRGPVFHCGADGVARMNEVIAGALGLTELTVEDLFEDQVFGGQMTAGWRTLDAVSTAAEPATRAPTNSSSELLAAIEQAETHPEQRPSQVVLDALNSTDPAIVAGAAHALGRAGAKEATNRLIELARATTSGTVSTNVRIQAMGALLRLADPRATSVAIERLADSSRTVRALAASTLGRLGAPNAVDPLITLLSREADSPGSKDRLAALDALIDLKPVHALLAAATAASNSNEHEGQALTFMFQAGSAELANEEPKVLMAVLDHPNVLLRRYAIQRLGELGDRTTADALEGRLAVEEELRPLVEISLNAVRGTTAEPQQQGALDGLLGRWNNLSGSSKMLAVGGTGGGLLCLIGFALWRRRSRRHREADAWAAMAAPSEDGYEAEYADGDSDADAGDYADEYEDQDSEEGQYGDEEGEDTANAGEGEFSDDVFADSDNYEVEHDEAEAETEAWDEEWTEDSATEDELEDQVAADDDDTYPYER